MKLTPYHAKYIAHELTRRCASDSVEKLTAVLSDAQVDLNPHQIEAALFAFRNPLSRGAILADEVGLGKTIEAGLLIAQSWAEGKRRILVIVPANLRKQWSQELADKFFLPSVILESPDLQRAHPGRQPQSLPAERRHYLFVPFRPEDGAVHPPDTLGSGGHRRSPPAPQRLQAHEQDCQRHQAMPWPRSARCCLTATPLQNSLLELYGLVSIIDDFAFGDLKTYRTRFTRLGNDDDFKELKERLKPICKRTLRKQVLEYVKYTNRHALVQEFVPTPEEQRLYDLVSDYLQQPTLYALPASQRSLMTLILRKLLASSTYAISGHARTAWPSSSKPPPPQAEKRGRPAGATGRQLGGDRRTGRRMGAGRRGQRRARATAATRPSNSPKCGRKWPSSASSTPWPGPSPRTPRAKSC